MCSPCSSNTPDNKEAEDEATCRYWERTVARVYHDNHAGCRAKPIQMAIMPSLLTVPHRFWQCTPT